MQHSTERQLHRHKMRKQELATDPYIKHSHKVIRMKSYEELLERAFKHMPEVAEDREERFVLPSPVVFIEGKTTIFENFDALCDRLNRDKEHIMKFLLNELGTAGKIVGNRAIFQGRFSREEIERQIRRYVDEYVMCWECNKPDTHFVKMERIWVLKCDACGAIRPLRRKAGVKSRK